MSRNIEAELHNTLLELAPDMHDLEEQSVIVAEATAIFQRSEVLAGARRGKKKPTTAQLHESRIVDSLLQAMGRLADWTDDAAETSLDATGLSPDQIMHRISYQGRRATAGIYGSNMDITNSSDLDIFLRGDDDYSDPPSLKTSGHTAEDYDFEDGYDMHCPELYRVPKQGRHRSDSLSR